MDLDDSNLMIFQMPSPRSLYSDHTKLCLYAVSVLKSSENLSNFSVEILFVIISMKTKKSVTEINNFLRL